MNSNFVRVAFAVVALVAIIFISRVQADPLPGEVLKFYQLPLNNGQCR